MKLEVGKIYRARDGSIVTITGSRGADSYPYAGNNGLIYTATGAYSISTPEHQWDLIEEVLPAPKLEVGKTYKDREGNVVTIVSKDSYHSTSIYPYLGNNASIYMEDGRFREYDLHHDYDLIEEVPAIGMFGSTWIFNNLKEEQTMQDQIVTLNCTLTVTTAYGEPRLEIYPKDEAWRASSVCTVLDDNFELVLPKDKMEHLLLKRKNEELTKAKQAHEAAIDAREAVVAFIKSL